MNNIWALPVSWSAAATCSQTQEVMDASRRSWILRGGARGFVLATVFHMMDRNEGGGREGGKGDGRGRGGWMWGEQGERHRERDRERGRERDRERDRERGRERENKRKHRHTLDRKSTRLNSSH